MKRILKVRSIIPYKDKLLLVRLMPYKANLKKNNDFWCLPGGTLEDNESIQAGLFREIVEETGVEPEIGNLAYIQQFHRGENDYLEFLFYITNAVDFLSIDLSKTSHGLSEIAEIGFKDPKKLRVLPKFLATEPLSDLASKPVPTKIFTVI